MLRARADRRVATALFIDVVDSTRIAADIGDRRWRELLASFRSIVRRDLRRNGGHEVDTAGDSFFATFDSPASALRAATEIVAEVQEDGLDVRCGLHTGELERIDGSLGGIGAHIAARVMAQAGAAQVIATATVRDLVVGANVGFEPVGEVELKGVPGTWALFRVTAVDRTPVPGPLAADIAAARRAATHTRSSRGRRVAIIGAALLVAGGAIAILQLTRDAATGETPSASMSASPLPPVALMKLDPVTRELVAVRDPALPPFGGEVQVADGNLWYRMGDTLTRRDLESGEVLSSIELPPEAHKWQPGFGSMWIGHGISQHPPLVDRVDPTSGRLLEQIDPQVGIYDFTIGDEAIYLLTTESEVIEVDPVSSEFVDRDATGTESSPAYVGYVDGMLVLWEGGAHRASLFDPRTDAVVSTMEAAQLGFGNSGVDPKTGILWVADRRHSTLTPFDLERREPEAPIGLNGVPRAFAFGLNALWLAAEGWVYRIDSWTREPTAIPMPDGVTATGVGIDEETQTIWISTCAVECEDPI